MPFFYRIFPLLLSCQARKKNSTDIRKCDWECKRTQNFHWFIKVKCSQMATVMVTKKVRKSWHQTTPHAKLIHLASRDFPSRRLWQNIRGFLIELRRWMSVKLCSRYSNWQHNQRLASHRLRHRVKLNIIFIWLRFVLISEPLKFSNEKSFENVFGVETRTACVIKRRSYCC